MAPKPAIVDWAAIRQEWENTDVSDQELATRWGFKSGNTIRRQRSREDWKRNAADVRAVNAARALEELAREEHVRAVAGGAHNGAHNRAQSGTGYGEKLAMAVVTSRTVRAREENRGRVAGEEDDLAHTGEPRIAETVETPIDEPKLPNLIDERTRATAEQLRMAQRTIDTAIAFLDHLYTVAVGDLETEEVAQARIRLTAINIEKDSIATLTKSFQGLLETGFKLKRQALGLDVAAAAKPGADAPGTSSGQNIQEQLGAMTQEELLVMRRVTLEVGRRNNVPVPPHIVGKAE